MNTVDVIKKALFVEENGGELEPIWQVYKPEGMALVIRQCLADAGLLVTDDMRAILDAAVAHRNAPKGDWWRFDKELHAAVDAYLTARDDQ